MEYSTFKRYCPHEITTKVHAVETYRFSQDISYVCRKYKVSKASLMRWNSAYDGTRESLRNKSHRPLTAHPNAHTPEELKWFADYHRVNPNISMCELYGKLVREKGYTRNFGSMYRIFVKLGYRQQVASTKKAKPHNKHYDTPEFLGIKWQLDVKYVPKACYSGNDYRPFYQYTVIDEASRERFIYAYLEQNGFSTIDFIKRAIKYFGYIPQIIQTDNGGEFTNFANTKRIHIFDLFCRKYGIIHKLIRPRTPWHNGKVERSHRKDQERFYNTLKFYSFEDLQKQMAAYLRRSNNIPMATLGWKTPMEMRKELLPKSSPRQISSLHS